MLQSSDPGRGRIKQSFWGKEKSKRNSKFKQDCNTVCTMAVRVALEQGQCRFATFSRQFSDTWSWPKREEPTKSEEKRDVSSIRSRCQLTFILESWKIGIFSSKTLMYEAKRSRADYEVLSSPLLLLQLFLLFELLQRTMSGWAYWVNYPRQFTIASEYNEH